MRLFSIFQSLECFFLFSSHRTAAKRIGCVCVRVSAFEQNRRSACNRLLSTYISPFDTQALDVRRAKSPFAHDTQPVNRLNAGTIKAPNIMCIFFVSFNVSRIESPVLGCGYAVWNNAYIRSTCYAIPFFFCSLQFTKHIKSALFNEINTKKKSL